MGLTRSDYAAILKSALPILDVRAPQEFQKGAIPNSINLPILDDDERAQVGIEYKHRGNAAAEALGHRLVAGQIREQRVASWDQFVEANPEAILTCWRGGKRSKLAQAWLQERGTSIARLESGFKAIRQLSISLLANAHDRKYVVLAGSTGVGKTQLLHHYAHAIDLEALANHRGSAFGRLEKPQPNPVTFELLLAQRLLQTEHFPCCLLEDESRTIGRLAIPAQLHEAMQTAPIVLLEASQDERIQLTYREYVKNTDPERLLEALTRIRKRLGQQRFTELKNELELAFSTKSIDDHLSWIRKLLDWYYDPMYTYQLEKKQDRIIFRGNAKAVHEYLKTNQVPSTSAH